MTDRDNLYTYTIFHSFHTKTINRLFSLSRNLCRKLSGKQQWGTWNILWDDVVRKQREVMLKKRVIIQWKNFHSFMTGLHSSSSLPPCAVGEKKKKKSAKKIIEIDLDFPVLLSCELWFVNEFSRKRSTNKYF